LDRCHDHNFRQFSAKKWRFSKTNVMITFFLQNYLLFESKTQIFSPNFSAKLEKII
jgi:hypothetical protein